MTPELYSESNVANSLSTDLAGRLLAAGYLLYWEPQDAVQTLSEWWLQFRVNEAAYLANPTFQARLAAAKGILTVAGTLPANPRFISRPTLDGSAPDADEVRVPAMIITLSAARPGRPYELGTTKKWRTRHLMVEAYVRNESELRLLKDLLALWMEPDRVVAIVNHDAGTLAAIGDVHVTQSAVDSDLLFDGSEATTHQVVLNAMLQYTA